MNEALAQWFSSGRVIDAVVAITLIEGAALAIYHRTTGKGVALKDYAFNMLSGLCLMMALRFALTGSTWPMVALCLSASGAIHALDLSSRWRRSSRQGGL